MSPNKQTNKQATKQPSHSGKQTLRHDVAWGFNMIQPPRTETKSLQVLGSLGGVG